MQTAEILLSMVVKRSLGEKVKSSPVQHDHE